MKQKIVMKVTINGDNDRRKALTIAAGMMGVSSVTIGGEDKNILTVIGNGVDIVNLTRSLMKKLSSATVVRMQPLSDIGGFDQEQAAAKVIYEGQPNYYGNNYTYYKQPKYSYYNPSLLSQYPPPPPPPQCYYNYSYEPVDSSCSIM